MSGPHDDLAEDLARHISRDGKCWTWLNIELPGCDGGRPDVLSFPKWRYNDPSFIAYEVKVSLEDLRRDLDAGKWTKYLGACRAVIFAMPSGLIKAAALPAGPFGVMMRSESGAWRTHRRPVISTTNATAAAMAKLLSSQPWREPAGRKGEVTYYGQRVLENAEQAAIRAFGKRYGLEAAKWLAAKAKGEDPATLAQSEAEVIKANHDDHIRRIREELNEICDLVGVKRGGDIYAIRRAVRDMAARLTVEGENAALYRQLAYIRDSSGKALELMDLAKRAAD